MNVESQQERRRLRAAMESMRRKRSMAVGGFVAALGLVIMADVYSFFPQSVLWAMRLAALVVLLLFSLPFLRALCPKCNGRYQSPNNLFRHPDRMPPCKSCGFSIDQHVSMY